MERYGVKADLRWTSIIIFIKLEVEPENASCNKQHFEKQSISLQPPDSVHYDHNLDADNYTGYSTLADS